MGMATEAATCSDSATNRTIRTPQIAITTQKSKVKTVEITVNA